MKFPLPVPLSFLRFDKECLAFRTPSEMLAHLDHILARPADFNPILQAAHTRLLAQHTWSHRPQKILAAAETLKI